MSHHPITTSSPKPARSTRPHDARSSTQAQSPSQHAQCDEDHETYARSLVQKYYPYYCMLDGTEAGSAASGSQELLQGYPGDHYWRSSPRQTKLGMAKRYRTDRSPTPPVKPPAQYMAHTQSPQREVPRSLPHGTPQSTFVALPSTASQESDASYVSQMSLISPPPPPFRPIILSRTPLHVKQVIVVLETATETF